MIGSGIRTFFASALALAFIAPGPADAVLGPEFWPGPEPGPHAAGVRDAEPAKDRFLLAGVFGGSVEFTDGALIFHIPSGAVRMERGGAG